MTKKPKELQMVVSNPIALLGLKEMESQLVLESKKRDLLTRYISKEMKEGIDYGVIEITSKTTGKTYRSKPTLLKPGAEKFASLFRLRAEYKQDLETWEMFGKKVGTICYVCYLYNGNTVVGEGRGVCTVSEKDGKENNAVKIAKKRAKIDAILETGALSGFFTQDLEDLEPIGTGEVKKSKTEIAVEAETMVKTCKSIENLLVLGDRILASTKFNEKQKQELQKLVTAKLSELENANSKNA